MSKVPHALMPGKRLMKRDSDGEVYRSQALPGVPNGGAGGFYHLLARKHVKEDLRNQQGRSMSPHG